MKLSRAVLIACTLIWPSSLLATPSPTYVGTFERASGRGFYVSAGYAVAYAPDETMDVTLTDGAETAFVDYDLGFAAISLAVGYAFGNGLRAEFETAFRRNELEQIEFSDERGSLNTGADDDVDALTALVNFYYEFPSRFPLRPYVGAGVGMASVGYDVNFSVLENFLRSDAPLFDDRDRTLVWQLIAGASTRLTRRTRLAAEYRYWRSGSLGFSSDGTVPASAYRTRHKLHMAGLQLQYFPSDIEDHVRSSTSAETGASSRGFYAAARFGAAAAEDSDIEDGRIDTNFDAFDLGPVASLAIGYQWRSRRGWPLRAEVEAIGFDSETDLVDFGPLAGEFPLRGQARTRALFLNLAAESGRRPELRPYAGIGVGYAEVDYDVRIRAWPTPESPSQSFVDDSDSSTAAQVFLGVRAALTKGLSLSLGYRYWWALKLKLTNAAGEPIETEHSAHLLQLGLHWRPGGR